MQAKKNCTFDFLQNILQRIGEKGEKYGKSMEKVGFHGFSSFQVGFSWFFMVPGCFFMVFHGFRLVFMVFLQNIPPQTVSWPNDPV